MYSSFNIIGTGTYVLLFILYVVITAIFSSWLASQKGYSAGTWGLLGLLFGLFALMTIGFAPIKQKNANTTEPLAEDSDTDDMANKKINVEQLQDGAQLTISQTTSLREGPEISSKFIKNLRTDTKVKFIKSGKITTENGITAPWFFIETNEGEKGWCFSKDLENTV
jgi:hypothetical protein